VLRLYVGIVYRPQIYRGILLGWFYDSAGIARDRDHWINENCLIARKARERTSGFYFSAAAGLALVFAAGLAADLAGACKDARRARVLTRLAACERLRVFLRALVFGMGSSLSVWLHPTLKEQLAISNWQLAFVSKLRSSTPLRPQEKRRSRKFKTIVADLRRRAQMGKSSFTAEARSRGETQSL